jgi:hypothetical protein
VGPIAGLDTVSKLENSIITPAYSVRIKKLVPVLPLTEHHSMKAHWGVEAQLHSFFDLGTRRR